MKIRNCFVSNSSSSSFIVKNYSPLSVQKEMFEIFMEHTNLSKEDAWKFFNEWYKFLSFAPMNRQDRKKFERVWYEYTCCGLEENDLPSSSRGTVVLELENPPFWGKGGYGPCILKDSEDGWENFKEICYEHFNNAINWKRLS